MRTPYAGRRRGDRGTAGPLAPRVTPLAVALVALAVTLAACGPAYRGEPLYGPLEVRNRQVALGERIFALHCQACHPGGDAGLGPALNDKPLPGWLIELQVRVGFGAMPAFDEERIDEAELDAVVAYLMALRAKEPRAAAAP